jgi:hypothetical protein
MYYIGYLLNICTDIYYFVRLCAASKLEYFFIAIVRVY